MSFRSPLKVLNCCLTVLLNKILKRVPQNSFSAIPPSKVLIVGIECITYNLLELLLLPKNLLLSESGKTWKAKGHMTNVRHLCHNSLVNFLNCCFDHFTCAWKLLFSAILPSNFLKVGIECITYNLPELLLLHKNLLLSESVKAWKAKGHMTNIRHRCHNSPLFHGMVPKCHCLTQPSL